MKIKMGCLRLRCGAYRSRRQPPARSCLHYYLIDIVCLLFVLFILSNTNSSCHLEASNPKFQVLDDQHSARSSLKSKLPRSIAVLDRESVASNWSQFVAGSPRSQAARSQPRPTFTYAPVQTEACPQRQRNNDRRLAGATELTKTWTKPTPLPFVDATQFDDELEAATNLADSTSTPSLAANSSDTLESKTNVPAGSKMNRRFGDQFASLKSLGHFDLDGAKVILDPLPPASQTGDDEDEDEDDQLLRRPLVSAQLTRLSLTGISAQQQKNKRVDPASERFASNARRPQATLMNPIILTGGVSVRSDLVVVDGVNSSMPVDPIRSLSGTGAKQTNGELWREVDDATSRKNDSRDPRPFRLGLSAITEQQMGLSKKGDFPSHLRITPSWLDKWQTRKQTGAKLWPPRVNASQSSVNDVDSFGMDSQQDNSIHGYNFGQEMTQESARADEINNLAANLETDRGMSLHSGGRNDSNLRWKSSAASTSGIRVTIGQGTRPLVLNSRGLITAAKRNSTGIPYNASALASQISYSLSPIENSIVLTNERPSSHPPSPMVGNGGPLAGWNNTQDLRPFSAQFGSTEPPRVFSSSLSWAHNESLNPQHFAYNFSGHSGVFDDKPNSLTTNRLQLQSAQLSAFQHKPPYQLVSNRTDMAASDLSAQANSASIKLNNATLPSSGESVTSQNNRKLATSTTRKPARQQFNPVNRNDNSSRRPATHSPPPYDFSSASIGPFSEPVNPPVVKNFHPGAGTTQLNTTGAQLLQQKPFKIRHKLQNLIIGKVLKSQIALAQSQSAPSQNSSLSSPSAGAVPHPILSSTVANNVANLLAHKLNSLVRPAHLFGPQPPLRLGSINTLLGIRPGQNGNNKVRNRLHPFVQPSGANIHRRTTGVGSLLVSGLIYGLSMLPALMVLTGVNPLTAIEAASSSLAANRQSATDRKNRTSPLRGLSLGAASDLMNEPASSLAYLVPLLAAANAGASLEEEESSQKQPSRQQPVGQQTTLKSLYAPPPTVLEPPYPPDFNSLITVDEPPPEEESSLTLQSHTAYHQHTQPLALSSSQLWPNRMEPNSIEQRPQVSLASRNSKESPPNEPVDKLYDDRIDIDERNKLSPSWPTHDIERLAADSKLHHLAADWFPGSAPINSGDNNRRPASFHSKSITEFRPSGAPIILGAQEHSLLPTPRAVKASLRPIGNENAPNLSKLTVRQVFPTRPSTVREQSLKSKGNFESGDDNVVIIGPYSGRPYIGASAQGPHADESIVSRRRRTPSSPTPILFSPVMSEFRTSQNGRVVPNDIPDSFDILIGSRPLQLGHPPQSQQVSSSPAPLVASSRLVGSSSNSDGQWRVVASPPTRRVTASDGAETKRSQQLGSERTTKSPSGRKKSKRVKKNGQKDGKSKTNRPKKRRPSPDSSARATQRKHPMISAAESELQMAHSMAMGSKILNEPIDSEAG